MRILTSDDGRILDNGIAIVVRQRVARLLAALHGHAVKRQVAVVLYHDCRRARPLSRVIARNTCITKDGAVAHHNRVALEQLEAVRGGSRATNKLATHRVGITREVDGQTVGEGVALDYNAVAAAIRQ